MVQFTPVFGEKSRNLSLIRELVESVAADIYVLPELCTTGYFFTSRKEAAAAAEPLQGPTCSFFRDLAAQRNAVIVAGFAEADQQRVYNACLIALPGRRRPHVYRKTHLFYKEKDCFDDGNTGFFVINDPERDVIIGPMICYDWRFPEAARILALNGADLIVCPSNLVTDAWLQVMPARAIENKVYLAVSNRAGSEKRGSEELVFKGNSAIYGYNGHILKKAGPVENQILVAPIDPKKTRHKAFNPKNDVFADRRPLHYHALVTPGKGL